MSTTDGRRGLLLPDLDDVETVDEQLRIAARKGGIDLGSDHGPTPVSTVYELAGVARRHLRHVFARNC